MLTDAEIEHMNEAITDTLGDYYENEDGELQPIPDDTVDEQKREVKE